MAKPDSTIHFRATLHRPRGRDGDWTFLNLPKEASDGLPTRAMCSVEGRFEGIPFATTLEPDGEGGHWMKIGASLRESARAQVGQTVELEIAPVAIEPEPEVPADLQQAIDAASPTARELWTKITPLARRDWVQWVNEAKRQETRLKRIASVGDRLDHGKKRPCCFDRSGMASGSLSCPISDDEA